MHTNPRRRALVGAALALGLATASLTAAGSAGAAASGSGLQLTQAPSDHQLFPRDPATDNAVVHIAGTVAQTGTTAVRLDVARDGQAQSSVSVLVSGAGASFSFAPQIRASLDSYSFSLYTVSGSTTTLQDSWSDVVAGDVFLVNGQSNAAARKRFASNPNDVAGNTNSSDGDQSLWVRTFGSSTSDPTASTQDDNWQEAEGDGYQVSGSIGQYALSLGHQEVAAYGIPIAILEGAQDAEPVTFFQRNAAAPADPATNYGRLLGRAERAGVEDQIRGIFWYQGESDNDNVASQTSGFKSLLSDWKTDYPGVQHVYAHQIRNGCLAPSGAAQPSYEEREAQREYESLPGVTVLSTTGISGQGPDNCHYYYVGGYQELATHDLVAMARDYYGGSSVASTAPDPLKAWFSTADHTEITISLQNATDSIEASCGPVSNFVINGSSVSVASMAVKPGFIYLRLTGAASGATGVSYVGHDGTGPWITNANGIGLLAFYGFPLSADQVSTFPTPLPTCVPAPTMARTAAGDFNGDGKADIAGIDANNNLKLYTGDGTGHLTDSGTYMLGTTGLWNGFKAITAGDFNGDGKADIAGIDANNNLKLYTGDGTGHLTDSGTYMLGSSGSWSGFRSLTAGDFNGDSKQDIAGIDTNNNMKLYTGDGTGHLTDSGTYMLGSTGLWSGFQT
jgi:hypothetical protein